MAKYHVNPETGNPGICRAKKECRFGDSDAHYDTLNDAYQGYEKRMGPLVERFDRSQASYNQAKSKLDSTIRELRKLRKHVASGKDVDFDALEELENAQRANTNDVRKALYEYKYASRALRDEGVLEYDTQGDVERGTFEPKGSQVFFTEQSAKVNAMVISELSAWTGKSQKNIAELIEKFNGSEDRDKFIVRQFQEGITPRKTAYVDLETSGYSPTTGEIIEIGIALTDENGEIVELVDERYDLEDSDVRKNQGVGATEVHKINPEDLEGKKPFTDKDVQDRIGRILNDKDTVIVAHQAGFERRFLDHYLDGFQAVRNSESAANLRNGTEGAPVQDTKVISEMLLHTTSDNKLGSFAEANGVPYEDAHSALPDALMTKKALDNFKRQMKMSPLGERPAL